MKRTVIQVLSMIMILSLLIVGCSQESNVTDNTPDPVKESESTEVEPSYEMPKFLSVGTAASGGAYYPIGIAIADIITNNFDIQATAQVTGGSIENNVLIQDKSVDMGITMTSSLFEAYTGQGSYEEECTDLNLLLNNMSTGIFHVVTLENSGINSMSDLKGKKVVMGPAGGGAISLAQAIWGEYGFTLDDIDATYISYSDGVSALKDGNVDAVIVQSAPPAAAIQELTTTTKGVKLLSIEDDMVEQITGKHPYLSTLTVDKDVYGLEEDAQVLYAGTCIAINKDLPDEFVYEMTKAIFENVDQIKESHPSAKGITLETAAKGSPIDIHPGALRYYEEQGVL